MFICTVYHSHFLMVMSVSAHHIHPSIYFYLFFLVKGLQVWSVAVESSSASLMYSSVWAASMVDL